MSSFYRNQTNNKSRRSSSSPYLFNASNSTRTRSHQRSRPEVTESNSRNRKSGAPPLRGSRSAPPNFQNTFPEIHEYYQRMEEVKKEAKKKLLKSKLDRLIDYQERLAKEIDELERDFDLAMEMESPSPSTRLPRSMSASTRSNVKLKQFQVFGGSPGNLAYKIQRKPDKDGKVRSFSLEVDVKGFMTDNIEIDTEDDVMTIKATKSNGSKRDLKVVSPTAKDMEKAYIHPPRFGLLVIDF